jgi:hypothetical protein
MKKIKVKYGEPFKVKIMMNNVEFFNQVLTITSIRGEALIPECGKTRYRVECVIEQGDYKYLKKIK